MFLSKLFLPKMDTRYIYIIIIYNILYNTTVSSVPYNYNIIYIYGTELTVVLVDTERVREGRLGYVLELEYNYI